MTFEEREHISLPDAIRMAAENDGVVWIHDAVSPLFDHEDSADCPCNPVRVAVLDIEHTEVVWSRT